MEYLILKFDGYHIAERALEGLMVPYKVEYDPKSILVNGLILGKNISFTQQALDKNDKAFIKRQRMNEAQILADMHDMVSHNDYERGIETFWEYLESTEIEASESHSKREAFLDEAMVKLYS